MRHAAMRGVSPEWKRAVVVVVGALISAWWSNNNRMVFADALELPMTAPWSRVAPRYRVLVAREGFACRAMRKASTFPLYA